MFEEIKKELQSKSDKAIYWYLKRIDLSSVIQYLKENSTYDDIPEKRKFKLVQDFLKGRSNICPVCGKIIEHGRKNCSMKCRELNPETQKRKKQTCMVKYGVENVSQAQEVKDKVAETNIKKFGAKSIFLTSEFKEKAKETNLERYGFEYAQQSDIIKEKTEATNLERYESNYYICSKVGRAKVKETFRTKHGVDSPFQIKEVREKARNTCLEHLGVEHPAQNKDVQEKMKNTNIKKYGVVSASQSKIKNYDLYYDKNYIKENLFLDTCTPNSKAIQEFFGISETTCSQHMRRLFGDEIHYDIRTSNSERELQEYVKSIHQNVICNDRTIIGPKELDIVLPDVKLAIEYDGIYWHNAEIKGSNYHLEKTQLCSEKGYQLFHIFEFDDIDIWKSMISNKLKLNTTIYARKCIIKELKYSQVKDFLTENHLQGACTSKINLGLFYNDELVEVMTFSKPRFNRNYDYELLRLCTKKYISVIGGASKLFKYFTSKNPGSIISYANRRFSNGNIYRQLGFSKLKESAPNYFYAKDDIILTRYQCQKHRLKDLFYKGILNEYESTLTESEIMDRNGYYKIYDCGNIVFEYR